MMVIMAVRCKGWRVLAGPMFLRDSKEIDCMLTIGLCDDEEPDLRILREIIGRYAKLRHISCDIREFPSGEDQIGRAHV